LTFTGKYVSRISEHLRESKWLFRRKRTEDGRDWRLNKTKTILVLEEEGIRFE
jgi:hypothetical protein